MSEAKIVTYEYHSISLKQVRQNIDDVLKSAIYGAKQTTLTIERSESKCGAYNMIMYISPDRRLKAEEIAKLYKLLSKSVVPNKITITGE